MCPQIFPHTKGTATPLALQRLAVPFGILQVIHDVVVETRQCPECFGTTAPATGEVLQQFRQAIPVQAGQIALWHVVHNFHGLTGGQEAPVHLMVFHMSLEHGHIVGLEAAQVPFAVILLVRRPGQLFEVCVDVVAVLDGARELCIASLPFAGQVD